MTYCKSAYEVKSFNSYYYFIHFECIPKSTVLRGSARLFSSPEAYPSA